MGRMFWFALSNGPVPFGNAGSAGSIRFNASNGAIEYLDPDGGYTSLIGPVGPTGATGPTGPQGPAGTNPAPARLASAVGPQGTGLTNVGLSVALASSKVYHFRYFGAYRTSSALAGMQIAVTYSGSSSAAMYTLTQFTALGTTAGAYTATLGTALGGSGVGPGATDVPFSVEGSVVCTTSGNLALQFQGTGASGTATIQAGAVGYAFEI